MLKHTVLRKLNASRPQVYSGRAILRIQIPAKYFADKSEYDFSRPNYDQLNKFFKSKHVLATKLKQIDIISKNLDIYTFGEYINFSCLVKVFPRNKKYSSPKAFIKTVVSLVHLGASKGINIRVFSGEHSFKEKEFDKFIKRRVSKYRRLLVNEFVNSQIRVNNKSKQQLANITQLKMISNHIIPAIRLHVLGKIFG